MNKSRITCCWILAFLLPLPVSAQDKKAEPLEAQLRHLEKSITAVRGLAFKTPVNAKVIARTKDTDPTIQGYYSPRDKSLFVYDDIKGNYELGVLIHEMVHALQDQHFNLTKMRVQLHKKGLDSDAELALAALVEGDATYTMIEVLKKEQPKTTVAAMLDIPLEKAKNLNRVFLYAQGARYVKALKERGGWDTVNLSYKFPPRNTATVLQTKIVSTNDLGPGKTQGALGFIKLLSSTPATRDQAFKVVEAWRGDRVLDTEAGQGSAWAVALGSNEAAAAFHKAMVDLKTAQHPDFTKSSDPADPTTVAARKGKGETWAAIQRGQRVYVVHAPSEKAYRVLHDRLEGPPAMSVWPAGTKAFSLKFGLLAEKLLDADVVCIGETHNAELHHRAQLHVIKSLFALDERIAVGLEMFQRPFQEHVDRYIKGETSEDEFLKATEYAKRWGYDWSLYKPIVDFCRQNRIPVAALNAPKELTAKISKAGHAGLSDVEKKQLGPIDFQHKKHRAHWYEELPKLHGNDKATPEQKERSYQVMAVWDDFMAASAAQFQKERGIRRMIVLAGSGHIDHGFGIPERIAKRTGGRAVTIKIVTAGDTSTTGEGAPVDYVLVVR